MRTEVYKLKKTLKSIIRKRGLHYANLAQMTGQSPATIKRLLNSDDISLAKLGNLCDCLEIDFFELAKISSNSNQKKHLFTFEQESILAKKKTNFRFFYFLILQKPIEEIKSLLNLTDIQVNKILKELEKYQLIKRMPYDKIKLLANFPFTWLDNGPLEKTYTCIIMEKLNHEIKRIGINRELDEKVESGICQVTEILLTKKSKNMFKDDLYKIIEEYKSISAIEQQTSLNETSILSVFALLGHYSWWDDIPI